MLDYQLDKMYICIIIKGNKPNQTMKLKTAKRNVKKAIATLVKSGDTHIKNIQNMMLLEKKNGIMGDEAIEYRKNVLNPQNKEHNANIDSYHTSIDNLKMLVLN